MRISRWSLPLRVRVLALLWGGLALPALAQYPATECEPLVPAPTPDDPAVLTYCTDHPSADCDLAITNWNTMTTHRSPDIRIGDPFNQVGPTPVEQPRVFLDQGNPALTADDRFYTKLYVKFRNAGGGPGGGGFAAAGAVTVDFSYKEVPDAAAAVAAAADPSGWTDAGTVVVPGPPPVVDNTYVMDVPSPGVLGPGSLHLQQRGVCWTLGAGDPDFPKKFVLRAQVNWPPDEDDLNDTAFSFYDLTAAGRRAQIGFALDLSGSMDIAFAGSTRLAVATEKAALFASLVEDDDQLGVFGFATGNPDNTSFSTTYNNPPTALTPFEDTSEISPMQTLANDFQRGVIAGQILAQSAHGCTPVGQGLLRARQAIQSATPPPGTPAKAIVLFSDGLQNVPPFVNLIRPACSGVAAPVIDAAQTFAADGIQIYSVYFGPEMGWAYDLMNELKNQTGGDYVYGTADELQLTVAYYSIRGLVDDLIFLREAGTVSAPTGTTVGALDSTFEVEFDAAATTATAAVSWPLGDGKTRLTLERRLQGASEWLPCPPPGDEQFEVELRPASFVVCRFTPGADSTWQFRVRQAAPRSGSTNYAAAVFAPVQTAEIHPSLDDEEFSTGDALTIRAELRTAGQPLTGATVTAQVKVPSRPFSTTLNRYSDRLSAVSDPDTGGVASLAAQLGRLLAQDGQAGGLYLYRTVPVTLRDDGQGADRAAGDGHYAGVLPGSETQVAGDYEVTINAIATLAGGREVRRIARLATICNVGPADPGATRVTVERLPDLVAGARIARVTVVPFDRFGNAAFPGSGRRITFAATGSTPQGDLVDRLDTRFTRDFRIDRDDAAVTVRVDGGVVTRDLPLLGGGGAPAKGREASLHLGVAIPHGGFGSLFSGGESLAVDYAWLLGGSFAIKAELALDRFDAEIGDDRDLTSLAVYLQHRWSAGPWEPYFEGGAGVYDLEDVSTAFGFAAGAGVQRRLAPHWSLDLNLQGHRVGGSLDLGFSRARVGVIYEF